MNTIIVKARTLLSNINIRQLIKFIFVGLLNTGVYYVVYFVLLRLGFFYAISHTIGNIIGIINSYFWNKFFTFRSKAKSINETLRFITVCILHYLFVLLIIYICIEHMGTSPELAGLIGAFIGMIVSYLGHKFWSFKIK